MTDIELIKYLWRLLANDLTDGDTPSNEELQIVWDELVKRGLEEGEVFEGWY